MLINEQVEHVIAIFDFATVARVYNYLDWTWAELYTGNYSVPSEERIKASARELLTLALSAMSLPDHKGKLPKFYEVTTGGLKATATFVKGYGIKLELEFVAFSAEVTDNKPYQNPTLGTKRG